VNSKKGKLTRLLCTHVLSNPVDINRNCLSVRHGGISSCHELLSVPFRDSELNLTLLTLSNQIFLPPEYSPALIYFGLERGWWITCPYYMRKSVGQAPTAERENKHNEKTCRTSSDIGAEQENHNVGRGPTLDRKGLIF
jgi:hypothetical protein